MAITQDVNININANTTDAGKDINKLENNIKTLDGAVNIVGGSIEVLAGSLALAGAVTEEQAEKFQTAAVGAIALADGSKRILEGYKTLATETKVLTVVQRIYNAVLNANPIFLLVTVLAAVTLGIYALVTALRSQREEQERLNEVSSSEKLLSFLERQTKLSKARGDAIDKTAQLELAAARQREKLAKDAIKFSEDEEEAEQLYRNAKNDRVIAEINLENAKQKILDDNAAILEARRQKEKDDRAQDLADRQTALEKERTDEEAAYLAFETVELRKRAAAKKTLDAKIEADRSAAASAKLLAEAETKIALEQAAFKEAAINGSIDNIQGALAALFGESKAVASANVLVDAAQAAIGIIKNSQTTGPLAIAYQASQFALLGATTVASLRQINSAEPGSGGAPDTPRPGGLPTTGGTTPGFSGPGFNLGAPLLGGTSGVSNISAVVLAGDVTSAQAQNDAIRNRRRFG
jgi:hypothetical protein